jgi:hypothetical protein
METGWQAKLTREDDSHFFYVPVSEENRAGDVPHESLKVRIVNFGNRNLTSRRELRLAKNLGPRVRVGGANEDVLFRNSGLLLDHCACGGCDFFEWDIEQIG